MSFGSNNQGAVETAAPCISELRAAVVAAPRTLAPRRALGEALLAAGRYAEAADVFSDLLDLFPAEPTVRFARGLARYGAGDLAGAEEDFRGVQRQDKQHKGAALKLARVRRERGSLEGARSAIRAALRIDPGCPLVRAELGWIQLESGNAAAASTFRNVCWAAPGNAAAQAGLARLEGGEMDTRAARTPEGFAVRADKAIDGMARRVLVAELQVAVERPAPATERARLYATLGDLHDALGQPSDAMLAWSASNRLMGGSYDARRHARRNEAVREVFDAARVAQRPVAGPLGGPVYVVGLEGSGANLVRELIGAHPRALAVRAQVPVSRLVRDLPRYTAQAWPDCVDHLARAGGVRLGARYQLDLEQRAGRASAIVDAEPMAIEHLGLAALLAPGARVVVVQRGRLDAALSAFRRPLRGAAGTATRDLADVATAMDQDEALLDHWRRVLPLPFHTVQYESLVQRPDATLADLWRFLRLPSAPAGIDLRSDRVGTWYRYARWLAPIAESNTESNAA
jgi:tetratricopeptide (TPR) repeat protein